MVKLGVLLKRYQLDEPLASGGMGKVFCATDKRLGRTVAVKMLRDDLAHDERFVERFRREARAAASLSHPNVAGVFDYGEDAGKQFIIMEYVEGRDLARVLREDGPLSPDRAARIGAQVADALGHAHAAGLVHRDVKPANVIVMGGDRVKVTDFGIARAAGDSTLTAAGSVLGTAHYISPEQAEGGTVGPPSDTYSLGIVLYEMLTGSLPFTGDSAIAVAMRHVSDEVPPPSKLNPAVPAELDRIVATATNKDPNKRFPDAQTMAAALHDAATPTEQGAAVAGVAPTSVLPAGTAAATTAQSVWPIPGDRWDPKRIGRAVVMTLAALLAIAILLLLWRLASGDEPGAGDQRQTPAGSTQPPDSEPTPTPAPATEMPNYTGFSKDEATDDLVAEGYQVDDEKVDSEEEKDIVLYIDFEAGANLTPGQTVTLYVSSGHEDEGQGNDKGKGHGNDKKDEDDDD